MIDWWVMLRMILVVLCLLTCLAGAEMPKVGDSVAVFQSVGIIEKMTMGQIIEMNTTTGLLQMKVDSVSRRTGVQDYDTEEFDPYNVTIAIPTITELLILSNNQSAASLHSPANS
jgi:hypothetical protein